MNTFSPLSYCDNNNNKKTTCLFNGDKRMTIFICQHCGREYEGATVCASDDCPGNEIKMPVLVEVWSVDSLAECLDAVGWNCTASYGRSSRQKGNRPKGRISGTCSVKMNSGSWWTRYTLSSRTTKIKSEATSTVAFCCLQPPGQRSAVTLCFVAVFSLVLFTPTRKQVVYGVNYEKRDDHQTECGPAT